MKRALLARRVASSFVGCPALAFGLAFALAFGLDIAPAAGGVTRPAPGARQRTRQRDTGGTRLQPVGCRVHGPDVARFAGTARAARRHEVALSFDDGPSALTQAFVRMLRAQHVVATFFVVGEHVSPAYRAAMREELRDGDAIGDHSWSHPDLVESREAASQLRGTREVIRRETAYTPCVFRPPYGAYDAAVVQAARALGLATVTWDVDPQDWALPGVAAIEQRVLAQVRPGSIVLSHDGGGPRGETLAAYPAIIAALRKRGYRFVTVPQILGFRTLYRRCATSQQAARTLRLPRCQGA